MGHATRARKCSIFCGLDRSWKLDVLYCLALQKGKQTHPAFFVWCDQCVPGALRKGKQPLVGSEWGLWAWGPCLSSASSCPCELPEKSLRQLLTPLRAVEKEKILCFRRQWWLGNPLMI